MKIYDGTSFENGILRKALGPYQTTSIKHDSVFLHGFTYGFLEFSRESTYTGRQYADYSFYVQE